MGGRGSLRWRITVIADHECLSARQLTTYQQLLNEALYATVYLILYKGNKVGRGHKRCVLLHLTGGVGVPPPRKIWEFRFSEIEQSEGQKSHFIAYQNQMYIIIHTVFERLACAIAYFFHSTHNRECENAKVG